MGEPDYDMFRRTLPILAKTADADMAVLLRASKLRKLPARSVLGIEGQPAETAYLLMKGRVRLSRAQKHGIPTVAGDVGAGGVVGVIGLLDNGDYMNSIEAISDVTALTVDRARLYALGAAGEVAVYRLISALAPAVIESVRRSMGRVDSLFSNLDDGIKVMERLILASSRRRS